ncbi:hypothetical protein CYMTET_3762 [Cymbomonas tetramitiformis]|uniref:Uncharacterized protein n=1 Tax=Cymbomonas tetramitiformis TaxID=36881 RepID=A0AAE0H2J8_9CHLO|nr:hypothetical protein CYMTET_3762 [Cymbomonas tetramitiformis]
MEQRAAHQPDDPCTAADLAVSNLGEAWSYHTDKEDHERSRSRRLWAAVAQWVREAFRPESPTPAAERPHLSATKHEGRFCSIDTSTIPRGAMQDACARGLMLVELCGGICAGLEALPKTGAKVSRYVYCDKDPVSRATAGHRLRQLHLRFPELLPEHAYADAFSTIAQDIKAMTPCELQAIAQAGMHIMVMAGTECQDLSATGSLQGLQAGKISSVELGRHSAILYDVVNLIGTLQAAAPTKLMYMIECVAAQHNFASREVIRDTMHPLMCAMIGTPVTCDAAQLGARAHRLRNYWHNLAPIHSTQHVLDLVPRDPARTGEVLDIETDTWTAPTVNERERAMGFETDATVAPGVSQTQRMAMIGRTLDVRAVSRLLAVTNLVNASQTESVRHPAEDPATHASYALTHADSMDSPDHSAYDADGAHDSCWEAVDHLRDNLQTLLAQFPRSPRSGSGLPDHGSA